MRRPFIKVCGLTREQDVRDAIRAGADALGFVLAPESPRYVPPDRARELARAAPNVARVGVVVSLPVEEVRRLVESIGLTAVQAHGEETVEECRAYGLPVVKAFAAGGDFDLERLIPFREFPVLLDGLSPHARGGTGRTANWDAARRARERGFRVLLAGGLSHATLRRAVLDVQPVAVDLNSGVERVPGIKDAAKLMQALDVLSDLEPPEKKEWPW
jgi:phosphoribosylanthranilate isomerase